MLKSTKKEQNLHDLFSMPLYEVLPLLLSLFLLYINPSFNAVSENIIMSESKVSMATFFCILKHDAVRRGCKTERQCVTSLLLMWAVSEPYLLLVVPWKGRSPIIWKASLRAALQSATHTKKKKKMFTRCIVIKINLWDMQLFENTQHTQKWCWVLHWKQTNAK